MTSPSAPSSLIDMALFSGAPQHENFCRLQDFTPGHRINPSATPKPWPVGPAMVLPSVFTFEGQERSTEEFLSSTDTAAVLVLVDGHIRHERYMLTGGPSVQWLSMSVGKSFVSALVGIAVEEGHISSIDDPISDYVPVNPGSAYDGVSIKDVLQMSSGARWNEDYADPDSDIVKLLMATSGAEGGLDGFVAQMSRESSPRQVCRYNSGETQILGALVARATGRQLTGYFQEKLADPLGFETPGHWISDLQGTEMSYGGLNLSARDFARLGELYRLGGRWDGQQIISEDWIKASTTAEAAIHQPGMPLVGGHSFDLGYGYQWWLPAGTRGEFSAIGVYNQFVYVDPMSKTTIVKLSANRAYGTSTEEATNRDNETIEFLRAVSRVNG